jgi:acyl transferase domain-containing protein
VGITTVQRRHALRIMLQRAAERTDDVTPWRADASVTDHFDGDEDLLLELHQEWVRLLSAQLHRGQIVAARTPVEVRAIYDDLCALHPTMRRLLDAHRAHPALWEPTAREHALLARIAGLVDDEHGWEVASARGRALVTQRIPAQRRL